MGISIINLWIIITCGGAQMSGTDIIILIIVGILMTLIFYYQFIKKQPGSCSCAASRHFSKNKLKQYYHRVKDR